MEIRSPEPASQLDPALVDEPSKIKLKLGEMRRRIKTIDLRNQIVMHPFAAVGIGAAAGALIGFVRPKPQPGRVTSAVVATLGAIAFRLVREAAVRQLAMVAKDYLMKKDDNAKVEVRTY